MRGLRYRAIPILAGLLVACNGGSSDPSTHRAKNLLILSVDTLRYDSLGFAGGTATPHLDALAAAGTSFSNAIAPMPRTTPALGSLLTGRWPQHHGSREVGDPLDDTIETIAQRLQASGWTTLGISVNDSAGPKQGFARGFDHFVSYRDLLESYGDRLYQEKSPAGPSATGWATATTDRALDLVENLPTDRPYFLWAFYFDPHFVYRPPSPWQDTAEGTGCWELYDRYAAQVHRGGEIFADIHGVASAVVDDCHRLYEAEVRYTDHEIGRLLQHLEERGLLEDTLIVFTSDHGENFGEAGLFFEHGDNAHDAGLRVPLLFQGSGVAAGRVDPTAVSLVDVYPTVLAWLGLEVGGSRLDGSSLAERIRESPNAPAPDPARTVFAESASALLNEAREPLITGRLGGRICANLDDHTLCREGEALSFFDRSSDPGLREDIRGTKPEIEARLLAVLERWPPESARERVARTARFKLLQFPLADGGYRSELYDLAGPGEGIDVAAAHPNVLLELEQSLNAWAAGIPRAIEREVDDEREKTLQNLGYVGRRSPSPAATPDP